MENARPQKAETSAPDEHEYEQGDDLFPESLAPIARTVRATLCGSFDEPRTAPIVSGQCAQVLSLIRQSQPLLSFVMTADHAIPEAAARVHDLRAMGFNILTTIKSEICFRGSIRRNVALYSLGIPEWPAPGFIGGGV